MSSKEFPENQANDAALGYDQPALRIDTISSAMAHNNPQGEDARLQRQETSSFFKSPAPSEAAPGMFTLDTTRQEVATADKDTPNKPLEGAPVAPSVAGTAADFFGETPSSRSTPLESGIDAMPAASLSEISDADIDSALENLKEAA